LALGRVGQIVKDRRQYGRLRMTPRGLIAGTGATRGSSGCFRTRRETLLRLRDRFAARGFGAYEIE
jgi:hypothetical protein